MTKERFGILVCLAVLAGTVVFAVWVWHYKTGVAALELDRVVQLAGETIELAVGSDWEAIEADDLPKNTLAGWHVPGGRGSVTVYVGRRDDPGRSPKAAFLISAAEYTVKLGSVDDIELNETTEPVAGFARITGQVSLLSRRGWSILALQVILLPDGSAVDVAVVSSRGSPTLSSKWAAQLVEGIRVKLDDSVSSIGADQPVDLNGWRLAMDRAVFVERKAKTGEVTISPRSAPASEFWRARVKTVYLPQYRDPNALVADALLNIAVLDDPVRTTGERVIDDLRIYKGVRDRTINRPIALRERECVYLVLGPDRSGVLLSVTSASDTPDRLEQYFDRVLADTRQVVPSSPLPALDVAQTLASADLARAASALNGWFEITQKGKTIGFCFVNFDRRQGDGRIVNQGFWYRDLGGGNYYTDQTRAVFADDLSSGSATVYEKAVFKESIARRTGHQVQRVVRFDDKNVEMVVSIDRQSHAGSVAKPAEFVAEGADLLLLAALAQTAGSPQIPEDGFRLATVDGLAASVGTISVKIVHQDDRGVRIFFQNDGSFISGVYSFDEHGVWQATEFSNDLAVKRSSEDRIRRTFPRWYRNILQWLQQDPGGSVI